MHPLRAFFMSETQLRELWLPQVVSMLNTFHQGPIIPGLHGIPSRLAWPHRGGGMHAFLGLRTLGVGD